MLSVSASWHRQKAAGGCGGALDAAIRCLRPHGNNLLVPIQMHSLRERLGADRLPSGPQPLARLRSAARKCRPLPYFQALVFEPHSQSWKPTN